MLIFYLAEVYLNKKDFYNQIYFNYYNLTFLLFYLQSHLFPTKATNNLFIYVFSYN